jgi:hypothetical protein
VKGSAKGSVKSAASAKSSRKETAGPDLVDGQRVWGKKTEKKPQADDYETKWSEDEWLPSEHGSQKDWDWKDKNRWWKAEWDESKPDETATVKDRLTELGSVLAEISLEIPDKPKLFDRLVDAITVKWRETMLPDNLLGYHVLSGANLSATERSTILTATASLHNPPTLSTSIHLQAPPQLALGAIERALLASWQDRELLERDDRESRKSSSGHKPGFRGRNNKAFALGNEGDEEMDEMSESDDEANLAEGDSEQEDVQVLEGLTDPGEQEYFALALERKYVAKEAYSKSKRTFRQAKDFVRKIKTSRNPTHAKAYAFAQKFKTRSTFTNNVPLKDKGQASGSGQPQRL